MNNLGNKIKELRIKHNFTQEELAEQLNISSQAVSKWENGISLPDIAQIVPLVNIFGITSDELLGISDTSENESVEELIKECQDYISQGYYRDKMFTIHDKCTLMLDKYPNNMRLLSYTIGHIVNLADDIKDSDDPDKERIDRLYKEAIRRANVVINYSKDITQVMDAKLWLVRIYSTLQDFAKAKEYAEQFPDYILYNKNVQLSWVYDSAGDRDNEIKSRCKTISDLIYTLTAELEFLAGTYIIQEKYNEAIYTYETILRIKDAIYQNDEYTPPMHTITSVYVFVANCYIKIGKAETALNCLERAYAYVCNIEKHYNQEKYLENPVLCGNEFSYLGNSYNGKQLLKDYMGSPWFDAIRDNERFVTVYEQL